MKIDRIWFDLLPEPQRAILFMLLMSPIIALAAHGYVMAGFYVIRNVL